MNWHLTVADDALMRADLASHFRTNLFSRSNEFTVAFLRGAMPDQFCKHNEPIRDLSLLRQVRHPINSTAIDSV